MLDHDPQKELKFVDTCGLKYDKKIEDANNPVQEIEFKDYEITVEVRSSKDPHYLFGKATGGKF